MTIRLACVLLLGAQLVPAAWTLYTCMATSKGYVVGAKLPPSGIFRREPDGKWTHAGYNHPFTFGLAQGSGQMYLAAGNGLIGMRNRATEWKILTGSDVTELRDVSTGPDGSIWFAHTAGLRVSRDGGSTWLELSGALPRRYSEAIRVSRKDASVAITGGENGLYRTTDGGGTWQLAGADGWQIMAIEQSPHDPCYWAAATQGGGLFASTDCGRSFENVGRIGVGRVLHSIAFHPSDPKRIAIAGWGFGIAVSEDLGRNWTFRNSGLPSADVWSVAYEPGSKDRLFASVHEEAVFRSEDGGRRWVRDGLEGSYVTRMLFVQEPAR
ncbi:MAG TPA: YCF48-related protein [Bryobacteraceae bacterium]|nr:YCF48-related protein [Bryobacteraceae bacterium]